MQHIFPEKSRTEIEGILENGFAYEYFNGMALVASKYDPALHDEIYQITAKLIESETLKYHDNRTGTIIE